MKKLFFTLAAVLFAVSALVSSCTKDINVDLKDLERRVSDLETALANGAVITAVDNTATGVKVTLSNGKTFTLNNGTNADVWTIGTDGYWYKNGVKQGYLATGTNGDTYVPNEDGYFYKNGVEKTDIKWKGASGDMAVVYNPETGTLTVTGAEGMEEGDVLTLGSQVLASLILDADLLTRSGKPLYMPNVGMYTDPAPGSQPQILGAPFEIVCELNPSNANVSDYEWAVIAESTPVFAQMLGVQNDQIFVVDEVLNPLGGSGKVVLLCSVNPDLDITSDEFEEFMENANRPESLELFVKATSTSGVTVTSNKGQFYPISVLVNAAALVYDFSYVNNQDPSPIPGYMPDSLHMVNHFVIEDVYCDRALVLSPVLFDGMETDTTPNADNFVDFDGEFVYYANAPYDFDPTDTWCENVYVDEVFPVSFPVAFEYVLEDEGGYFAPGNEFVDEELLAEGVLAFTSNDARFTDVKIAIVPSVDDIVLEDLVDTLYVTVGDNAPQSYETDPIDLGDVDYMFIDTATVGATPAYAITNVLNEAIETTGFVGFDLGGWYYEEGDYGQDVAPAAYSQLTALDTVFALTKRVPFGEGSALVTFVNPNGDEITIPIVWNVVVATPAFELYEDVVTLSAHKAADAATVAGTATHTYYDITPYNVFENVNKEADPTLLDGVLFSSDFAQTETEVELTVVTPGEEETLSRVEDLEDDTFETDIVVSALCASQAWDDDLDAWVHAALTEETFTVVFVNDLAVEVGSPIAVTTVGNVETDSICLVDYITVSNANEVIFQGAAVSGTSAEVINDLFIVDNTFLTFSVDESTFPPTVLANHYLTWNENGVVIWNEVAAQDGSYTQTTDVEITFTVTAKLGSTVGNQLVATATGTFTLKKKF
ncbi:MAG: hypothetical protein IJS02_03675 [Bacteroidales bacterium]|nr:hypothetical protein [Bacteroidales bacterium]